MTHEEVMEQVREKMVDLIHIKWTPLSEEKEPVAKILSILPEFQQRQCLACKEFKPLTEFTKNKRNKEGLQIYCRVCRSEKIKKYRWENRENIGKYKLAYYNAPKGKYKILTNRAKRDGVGMFFGCDQFINWYAKRELKCHYCGIEMKERGKTLDSLTFDRADNSEPYTLENIRLACRRCNTTKGSWFNEKQMLQVAGLYFGGNNNELKKGLELYNILFKDVPGLIDRLVCLSKAEIEAIKNGAEILIKDPDQSLPDITGRPSGISRLTMAADMKAEGWVKVRSKEIPYPFPTKENIIELIPKGEK